MITYESIVLLFEYLIQKTFVVYVLYIETPLISYMYNM